MVIKLLEFQKEAVKRSIGRLNQLLCIRTGGGKTIIAMCYAKLLLKKNLADKIIFACTVSASVAVRGEFKEKLGIIVPQFEEVDAFLEWLKGDGKICVIKHSFFEKLGFDQNVIDELFDICTYPNKRCAIIIDEVHKLSNDTSIAHTAFLQIKFMFQRILLMTATPYSSCLSQFYGIIKLIQPTLWKNKAEFFKNHIEEMVVRINGKVRRKEKIAYKNLSLLRKLIEPFTYFYYPKIKLNFFDHKVILKDYKDYDEICKGVLTVKELEKLEGKNNGEN